MNIFLILDTLTDLGIDQGILEILKAKWGRPLQNILPRKSIFPLLWNLVLKKNPLYTKWVKYTNFIAL